ncbi:MAG: hypothetical protein HY882_11085 [Deltaproteobacteria bacterium]|nr:hypothetical protein [Deltaproteobacteria bacterium]
MERYPGPLSPLPRVAECRKVQNPSFMDHGDPGNKWPLDPQILAQLLGMDGGFSGAWG